MSKPGPKHDSKCATNGIGISHAELTHQGIIKARAGGSEWGTNGKVLADHNRKQADVFAADMRALFLELGANGTLFKLDGTPKVSAMARELNARQVDSPKGARWHATSVRRLLNRLGSSFVSDVKQVRTEARNQAILNAPEKLAESLPSDHPILKKAQAKREELLKELDQ